MPLNVNVIPHVIGNAVKMSLFAVSSPIDVEIDGRKPQTIEDQGIDLAGEQRRVGHIVTDLRIGR